MLIRTPIFDTGPLSEMCADIQTVPDIRLVNARRLTWNKDAWREPGFLGLVTRELERMICDAAEAPESRAEARVLVKKLYAIKRPFP